MYNKIKLSEAERFVIEVLFNDRLSLDIDYKKIDFDSVVKIASRNLMLPSLYVNIKRKNITNRLPKNLIQYLKEIFNLNLKRNKILIKEINELSKILEIHKIEHVFLKGSAHIINNMYYDIGERMIGDIDFLIRKTDSKMLEKLLLKYDYHKFLKYSFFEFKHLERRRKPKKIFAIEPHIMLLDKENHHIDLEMFFKSKKKIRNVYVPDTISQLKNNIYNYQINDRGSCKLSYSLRSLYDMKMMIIHEKECLGKIKLNHHVNKYFMIANKLDIIKNSDVKYEVNKVDSLRFDLKKKYRLLFLFDNLIISMLTMLKLLPKQIFEIIINKEYRKYAVKKIFRKL